MPWPKLPTIVPARAPRGALGARLTRLALGTTVLTLLVIGSVLNIAMGWLAKDALVDETATQARVLAENLGAAVLFQDAKAGSAILASLQRSPSVRRAAVFLPGSALFIEYTRPGAEPPVRGPPNGSRAFLRAGVLVVDERIDHAGMALGHVRFEVPLAPLYRRAGLFAALSLAAAAAAVGLAYLLAVGVRRDVDTIERRLDELAYLDPVTGLYNRHAAHEHLAAYVAQAARAGEGFTIVTFDLDDFKAVNDSLGHHIGDELLRLVARRLKQALKAGARAYRFGGDEFVMICPWPLGWRDPERYGALAREVLGGTVQINGIDARLGGSVGIARYPQDGERADAVLLASDMAMYEAKALGKNRAVVFHAGLREQNEQWLRLDSDLRTALRTGQLELHYQPIVDLFNGRQVASEALLRWQHPDRGMVSPAQFIQAAERSGLIVELGGWVLEQAAVQQRRWSAMGLKPLPVAVNVSARQLREGRLLQQLDDALRSSGCAPQLIEIELTEHTLVEDIEPNIRLLDALRQRGVRIAIDDFGTGLSSLSYLKRLPAAKLKIDRSFIRDLPHDKGDVAIVEAAVSMAHALGLQVVAEGVETMAQHLMLARLGCNFGQGYLYSAALDSHQFADWMKQRQQQQRESETPA